MYTARLLKQSSLHLVYLIAGGRKIGLEQGIKPWMYPYSKVFIDRRVLLGVHSVTCVAIYPSVYPWVSPSRCVVCWSLGKACGSQAGVQRPHSEQPKWCWNKLNSTTVYNDDVHSFIQAFVINQVLVCKVHSHMIADSFPPGGTSDTVLMTKSPEARAPEPHIGLSHMSGQTSVCRS